MSIIRKSFFYSIDRSDANANLPVAYCIDLPQLIERVKETRSASDDDQLIKLGIDSGGGSFKITLTIMSKDPNQQGEGDFKNGGVRRIFILVLVPGLPEKYHYVDLLWRRLLSLDKLDAVVACDLKMSNIMVGLMAHSSSYPCPYCEAPKKNLTTDRGRLRSIANIRENLEKSTSQFCCINDPVIPGNPESPIYLAVPPPPLHLTLGIVNTVYKAVEKIAPDWSDLWVGSANVRHQQRGYGFTGGACQSLIKSVSALNDNEDLRGYVRVSLEQMQIYTNQCFIKSISGFAKLQRRVQKVFQDGSRSRLRHSD